MRLSVVSIVVVTFVGVCKGFSPVFDHTSQFRTQGQRGRNVIALNDVAMSEVLVPSALFFAALAATVLKADKSDSTVKAKPIVVQKVEAVTVESVADVVEVPTPSPVKAESPKTVAPEPAPAPVAPKPVAAKPAPAPVAPKPAPAPVSPKPVAAVLVPAPEPVAAEPVRKTKDISQLKMEIASTLEQEKEKVNRLIAAEQRAQAAAATAAAGEVVEEFVEEFLEEPPVAGRKRKFVAKLFKKVIAPWRKWSTIN